MKMKIEGTRTEVVPVKMEIDVFEVFCNIRQIVFRKAISRNITDANNCWIQTDSFCDSLVETVEYHTSHSWDAVEVRVKELTAEQKDLFNAFKLIELKLRNLGE